MQELGILFSLFLFTCGGVMLVAGSLRGERFRALTWTISKITVFLFYAFLLLLIWFAETLIRAFKLPAKAWKKSTKFFDTEIKYPV